VPLALVAIQKVKPAASPALLLGQETCQVADCTPPAPAAGPVTVAPTAGVAVLRNGTGLPAPAFMPSTVTVGAPVFAHDTVETPAAQAADIAPMPCTTNNVFDWPSGTCA
jgi:hypothetical protein